MSSLYPIPESSSGAEAVQNSQTQLAILETLLKKDEATIADPKAAVADKFTAFQELSGYINGTDSRFAALDSDFDAQEKAALKTATLNSLSNFNDVEIPVGKDKDGNVVYKRVYTDAAETQTATAADFVKAWEDTGANGTTKTNFFFSFTSDDIDRNQNNDEAWAGGASTSNDMAPNGCYDDAHDHYNPTGEAGKGITVTEHDSHSCSGGMTTHDDCSGDAQAIAAYCDYHHENDGKRNDNFDYNAAYDDFNNQMGFGS